MLLYPQHQNDVPEILQLIQQVQTQSSVHLDGEIQIHPDGHVSFNELITVFPAMKQQVIVKGIQRVDMLRLEQLFEGNLEYADATTT
jgi:phosphoribosyl-dephospho-CoA transferase